MINNFRERVRLARSRHSKSLNLTMRESQELIDHIDRLEAEIALLKQPKQYHVTGGKFN